MKILDRYILTTYLKTFLSVFIILMLIFVLQTIWLYIKELAGKDLDIIVVAKFLLYFAPKLIPLVLPLTILLASIMVFGSFAENYEFAAMKSTGISLQRAMAGLSVFIGILAIITFFFANNVIPWAEFNSYNLRKNIAKLKPAMVIAEGQFNEVGNITIKVDEKSGDRGQYLKNVILHQSNSKQAGNFTTIVSKTGELMSKEDSEVLKLVLFDGNYYDDTPPKNYKERNKRPFKKSDFETYTINIDLSQFNNIDLDEKNISDKYNMLNISDLSYTIDTLKTKRQKEYEDLSKTLYGRTNISEKKNPEVKEKDSLKEQNILDLFEDYRAKSIVDVSLNTINSTSQILTSKKQVLKNSDVWLNKHIISLHEKLALPFACIILFFVGAPLGALIRKGGLGLPMVIAILLFLTYHFIGIFAKNSAKDGSFNPILASWFSTLIMLPLGIYLTKRATADQGLFESIGILERLKKLFGIKKKQTDIDESLFKAGTTEFDDLNALDNKKLIDVIKNYRQYDINIKSKNTALFILNSRGVTKEELKFGGNLTNQKFEEIIRLKDRFDEDSKLTFILYFLSIPFIVIGAILKNNGYAATGKTIFIFGIVVGILYLFALIRSFFSHSNLNKQFGTEGISNAIFYLILGLPLYMLFYFFQKKKIEEDLHLNIHKNLEPTSDASKIEGSKFTTDYHDYALFSFIFYCLVVVFIVLNLVLANNKQPALALASMQLALVSVFIYILYHLLSFIKLRNFYKENDALHKFPIPIFLLGVLIQPFSYFSIPKRIQKDFY
ncbi:MAG: LptF/LptG family permease [Mangrovimonas sp.]|nr:LptF/LptG family permease [Mangrovimonas sp.]MCB0432652.1 LptF/LptG family permease [Mangrovimonas sp.]MCB0434668.1 LptF/LptG family permease [Mangrovimonas sp.]MCB0437244.1 LptF/LptG family permease [Mangrovimonas sp.]